MKTKIHVFGHYDSRGGTSAFFAATKEEAARKYTDHFWSDCFEGQELEDEIQLNLEQDYLGEYEIEGLEQLPENFKDGELENEFLVIERKDDEHQLKLVAGVVLEDEDDAENVPGYPEYRHRRWDDDAYSFWLVRD